MVPLTAMATTSKEAEPPPGAARAMLRQHLASVCAQAAAIVVSEYEGAPAGEIEGLVQQVEGLLRAAQEALDVVAVLHGDEECQQAPSEDGAEERDRPTPVPPLESTGIAGAVVLARMGLLGKRRQLRSLGEGATPWERISVAGSVLRTVQRSLGAVDRAMAEVEQAAPHSTFYERNVDVSLEIRRRYVDLHRTVAGGAPQDAAELAARLRCAGTAISRLFGLPIAVQLRTGDRALLMMMRSRARDWLSRNPGEADTEAAGMRLWQDVANVAAMLLEVSRREELVQHDAALAARVLAALPASDRDWDDAARAAVRARLRPMGGRSPVLDALVEAEGGRGDLCELRRLLAAIAGALGPVPPESADAAPLSGKRPVQRG